MLTQKAGSGVANGRSDHLPVRGAVTVPLPYEFERERRPSEAFPTRSTYAGNTGWWYTDGVHRGRIRPLPVLLIDNLIMAIGRHDSGATSPLLTIEEVAAFLHVSKTSVYRLVERRELTFCRVGRSLRFNRADLEIYLAARRVTPIASDETLHERTQDTGPLVR